LQLHAAADRKSAHVHRYLCLGVVAACFFTPIGAETLIAFAPCPLDIVSTNGRSTGAEPGVTMVLDARVEDDGGGAGRGAEGSSPGRAVEAIL
jgi:hypothetical protein